MRSGNDPGGSVVAVYPFKAISGDAREWIEVLKSTFEEEMIVVIASAETVFGPSQASSAFYHAMKAIDKGSSRARDSSIEVLRWLTGSRQVQEALETSKSGGKGSPVLVMTFSPHKFVDDLPEVRVCKWDGGLIPGLEAAIPETDDVWGGRRASTILGLDRDLSDEEMELAVLEKVAATDL